MLLTEGCFPAAFKMAQVLRLLKKPGLDKEQMSNYWPISNLTTISKVIEQLAINRLRPHLVSSEHFARLQWAYRPVCSTEMALLHIMNTVYMAADIKKVTALVSLDISAAFDTIDHHILIDHLDSQFGVDGTASTCLRSYLSAAGSSLCDSAAIRPP